MRHPAHTPDIAPEYGALMRSERISARTRKILEARSAFDDQSYTPKYLSPRAFATLEAIVMVVLPQGDILGQRGINLAARIDARLGGPGDGWRFDTLPQDQTAYELALCALDDACLTRNGTRLQDADLAHVQALLRALDGGTLATDKFDARQLKQWFSDLCADCVQIFIMHPAVQAQLGIDAAFNGGDATFQGFDVSGAANSEGWEPPIYKKPDDLS